MFSSDRFSFDTLRNSDATRKMEKQRALVTVAVYIAMAFAAKMCFVCYCFQFLIVTIAFYYRYKLTLHIYIYSYILDTYSYLPFLFHEGKKSMIASRGSDWHPAGFSRAGPFLQETWTSRIGRLKWMQHRQLQHRWGPLRYQGFLERPIMCILTFDCVQSLSL